MANRIKMLLVAVLIGTAILLPNQPSVTHADPIGCGGGCAHSPTPTPTPSTSG